MRVAIAFRDHVGPIQNSLRLVAEERGYDVLVGRPKDMKVNHDWDSYDKIIWFDNRVPTVKTTAKVCWWMCDLRHPAALPDRVTTANYIALCNSVFLSDYENAFQVPAVHVPQCGNDTPVVKGRNLDCDVLFLGSPGKPAAGSLWGPGAATAKAIERNFHCNRVPIISAVREKGLNVQVIHREGATKDSKWLYKNAPISLSISLPVQGYTSNRMYNILASEGFCLVAYYKGLEEQFENHKHLVWFKSYEEAAELAQDYMGRPDDRNKIARAGHQEYLANHTAASRVDAMLEAMS